MNALLGRCVFCQKFQAHDGPSIAVGSPPIIHVISFEPLNPVTPGHRLFIPDRHVEAADTEPATTGMTFQAAAEYGRMLATDFNLIVNAGPNAGQTVQHLHVHYVPRREGDGLIMPWTKQ